MRLSGRHRNTDLTPGFGISLGKSEVGNSLGNQLFGVLGRESAAHP